jgi:hypothetical protein
MAKLKWLRPSRPGFRRGQRQKGVGHWSRHYSGRFNGSAEAGGRIRAIDRWPECTDWAYRSVTDEDLERVRGALAA